MMTSGIPWPIAYTGFVFGAAFLGWLTYRIVRRLDRSKAARASGSGG